MDAELRDELRRAFRWRGDRVDHASYADMTAWWRSPALLRELGPALAEPFAVDLPTAVLGVESRGSLLGPLVALALGAGFVEVRKNHPAAADSDAWLRQTTPPDYRDRNLALGMRGGLLRAGDRALLVDDWIETGSQATAAHRLVLRSGATWLGVSTVVDGLVHPRLRHELNVHSLLTARGL
ncbi:MAG TPA: adenine phosphoribosyltransferase [Pseudonocardiaceae bacterium]|nr:adenine phosphoribosyltransferase [Pseudonocardiaceae bacterium]